MSQIHFKRVVYWQFPPAREDARPAGLLWQPRPGVKGLRIIGRTARPPFFPSLAAVVGKCLQVQSSARP